MDMDTIRRLVGDVTREQLRHVDGFVSDDVALFMPACGACFYALTPLHSHPSYMFVIPFNDQTVVEIDGKRMRAEPGKLFALSPGIEHHELPSDTPPRYIAILAGKAFFEERLYGYPIGQDIEFNCKYHDPAPDLLPLLRKFMAESENCLPGAKDLLRALGTEICHSIIRSICKIDTPKDRMPQRIEIDRVVEYLHANLGKRITIEDMTAVANMSPSHFSRTFKKEVGTPPVEYLNHIRIERVRKLLLAGERSITDIAIECGFGSPAYLSERFFRRYGLAPSEYRESMKKGFISKKKGRISKDRHLPSVG